MSNPNTISGLPELVSPAPGDVFPVVQGGVTQKLPLEKIRQVLANATTSANGLMQATDKVEINTLRQQMDNILSKPTVVTVASAGTVVIPNDADVIILTGSTNVSAIVDAVDFKVYVFYYPSGPGISVLGAFLAAQEALVMVHTP
jgi:hypothetical protein